MRDEKVASAQDFVGNQRERTTLGCGFLFLVHLVTILHCLDIVWPKDLSGCFFSFLPILDREFSFFSFLFCSILQPFLAAFYSANGKDSLVCNRTYFFSHGTFVIHRI